MEYDMLKIVIERSLSLLLGIMFFIHIIRIYGKIIYIIKETFRINKQNNQREKINETNSKNNID